MSMISHGASHSATSCFDHRSMGLELLPSLVSESSLVFLVADLLSVYLDSS